MNAEQIAELLGLQPHPEGGRFRETWVGPTSEGRATGTAIYFLLAAGEWSHWHRVDAAEIWHHYAGDPLELSTAPDDSGPTNIRTLGVDLEAGERPQLRVDAGHWQSARTTGDWTLVGCTVSPGFEFDRFELAPPDWSPGS